VIDVVDDLVAFLLQDLLHPGPVGSAVFGSVQLFLVGGLEFLGILQNNGGVLPGDDDDAVGIDQDDVAAGDGALILPGPSLWGPPGVVPVQ